MPCKIAILTDSTCDLPAALTDDYGISVIPQQIIWEGQMYLDGVHLSADTFYHHLAHSDQPPTTAPPTPDDFALAYEQARAHMEAEKVIAVLLSSRLSSTFAHAQAGAQLVDFPVFLYDTQTVSMGLGFAVLAAAQARNAGAAVDGVLEAARQARRRTHLYFTVHTLDFLRRGGRISHLQHVIGAAFDVRPILHIHEGQIEVAEITRKLPRAVQRMLELAHNGGGAQQVAVMHGSAPEAALALEAQIRHTWRAQQVMVGTVGPTLGVHTGPGVLGIAVQAG